MNEIICGDCLELMQEIPDASVDAIITDPPYAITAASWDQPIDWQAWWQEIRRIRKPAAPTVVFCSGKFCGVLWQSNPKEYRYDWIWVKNNGMGFLESHHRPLRIHENIFVFAEAMPKYNPQFSRGRKYEHVRIGNCTGLYHEKEQKTNIIKSDGR